MKNHYKIICDQCGKEFWRENKQQYRKDRYKHIFCSRKCQSLSRTMAITKSCAWCKKNVTRTQAELNKIKRKSQNIFCNNSCAANYNNTHKTTGTRVSKLERYFASELVKMYPDLEFHFNRKDAINSELDIYIPEFKLAFELNGIFHYEPIYGKKKLSQIENNDKRKFQACIDNNIELCIIDSSGFTYFKPKKADKYLEIVTDIIDMKLFKKELNPN